MEFRRWGTRIAALVCAAWNATAGEDVMACRTVDSGDAEVRAVQERVYRSVETQARYLLGTVRPWDRDPALKLLTDSRSDEHHIRPNTGAVEGFCFLRRFGPYDEKTTGVSRDQLLNDFILPMLWYLVETHVTDSRKTGDGKAWGNAWQSAHWTQMLGRGAWWIWADLPDDLRAGVRRVVAHEADRIAAATPPHQLKDDTKAEENAWNSQVLSVAMLLMPQDARRATWEPQFQRWAMSSFLRPSDATNSAVLDGRPVRDQFSGANIFDDFTLENHGIVHPDYMSCFALSLGCAADFAMSGRQPPGALLFNAGGLYENLKWMMTPDTGSVYPSGQDWELFRMAGGFGKHVMMATFARDPDGWPLAVRTLEVIEKMQARPGGNGGIYFPGEYFFPSTQTDIFSALARAWLNLSAPGVKSGDRPRQLSGVRRLDGGKMILNRTPTSIHTLSWGSQIMAQCVPFRLDRIVSPDLRSGLGQVRLAGQTKPLPLKLRDVQVENDATGFTAALVVEHGHRLIESHLSVQSKADGSWRMDEELVAVTNVATAEILTGLIGILNNSTWVYEQGRREVVIDGGKTVVPAHSGRSLQSGGATEIVIDDVLVIRGREPLRIRYAGATKAERGRATDRLYLNAIPGAKDWKAGQTISKYSIEITCRPAVDAAK